MKLRGDITKLNDPKNWNGQNLLGKCITRARDKLLEKCKEEYEKVTKVSGDKKQDVEERKADEAKENSSS